MAAVPLRSMDEFKRLDKITEMQPSPKLKGSDLLQKRFILVVLCIFVLLNFSSTRVSISIGIVCMVNHTAVLSHSRPQTSETNPLHHQTLNSSDHLNKSEENVLFKEDGPFVWDEELQGIILSSYFWGFAATQVAGGYLANMYGAKWVLGITMLTSSLLTMLTPFAANFSPELLIFTRVLCGAAHGFLLPVLVLIFAKWAPNHERARLFTICLLGLPFGVIMAYTMAPALCGSHLLGGWPMLFYVIGLFGVAWFVLWSIFMYEHPSGHPWITDTEKHYIESCNMYDLDQVRIPWTSLLKSTPLWALGICEFCHAYKYFMLLTQLPTYLKVVMHVSMQEIGFFSSVPQLASPFLAVGISWVADILISKKKMKVGTLRKSLTLVGFGISSGCLLFVILLSTQKITIITLIWISCFMDSAVCAGFEMSPYDMAPNFAGIIKGIVHTLAAIAGIVSPYVTGILTKNNNTKTAWDTSFAIALAVHMFGGIIFVLFASGDIQPWNYQGNNSMNEDEDDERPILYGSVTKRNE